ncbi:MAG: methylmalonyl Co-A mutase-associated GTPase MeaB [candidate division Zixibacteria bacterium]|nr:methylmalonyl Co-A mutase-associated GTPase MeaB [candidate division Zixibacteria bacterium]
MSLYDKFLDGSVIALSRIISHIENLRPGYQELLSRLYRRTNGIYRIGLTGPPGAGKSSLVNLLAGQLADDGRRVAVICVDPSSPFTGGAFLGDRIRMQDIPVDKGVFIRSMGSRGSTGGLAAATSNVTVALDAFGFDTLIIETVGVGQMELDIIDACDTVVVTLVPESGDAIQALKAGLMEIADVFAVNKSDRAGAEQMLYDLKSALEMRTEKSKWEVPVIATQALHKKNTEELLRLILEHKSFLETSGQLSHIRGLQLQKKVETVITRLVFRDISSNILSDGVLEKAVDKIMKGEEDPYSAGMRLYKRFKLGS